MSILNSLSRSRAAADGAELPSTYFHFHLFVSDLRAFSQLRNSTGSPEPNVEIGVRRNERTSDLILDLDSGLALD